ncbi:RHS repeat-associated core domain-containing protein [Streptomyces sp. NPDC049915]|uniref:RHS repeat protein n=1 Tax=Streptomyces sp. NPDC049915 TaxID=3155510 RepID=UPI00343E51B9
MSPALKTAYTYDSAGRVVTLTPPGELPWTFAYGTAGNAATAGPGMLLSASRPTLVAGSKTQTDGGTATTSVVYDVPLTGSNAPYQVGTNDVAAWGQANVPTDATAVFPPDSVPASHTGSALTAASYARASVSYADASGREVDTLKPGGHLSVTEYDRLGNTVRELSAGNQELALSTSGPGLTELTLLGINGMSTADREQRLSTTHVNFADGQRELETFGPLHMTTLTGVLRAGTGGTDLPAGTEVAARRHTVTAYDEGRPTDGTAKVTDLPTTVTVGADVDGYPSDGDTRTTRTAYDWAKGFPTSTTDDPGGLNLVKSTSYDAQGRITKEQLPGASGTDAATQVTTYWSAAGSGTCTGRPEWADLVCSTGPAGDITGGGSNPTQLPTTTYEYGALGNITAVIATANGVTRTTTTTYDGAGRAATTSVTGGTGQAVPTVTTGYDSATGLQATTSSSTVGTVTKAYDMLGRQVSYTDADSGTTTAEYDVLDRPVKITNNSPSTVTYTYDTAVEPRGLAIKATDSVAGVFQATYDADGTPSTEKLPGGYSLTVDKNPAGETTGRTYTRDSDSDSTVVYSDNVTSSIHGQATTHAGWSDQTYRYDAVGHLTEVEDTSANVCTRRTYTFDARANRKSLTPATGDPGAACPTTGGTTVSSTYDSGDRIVDTGYTYDAFGRTTALPGNGTIGYYTNDLVYQQIADGRRQTWELDPELRLRPWKTETGSGSTWTETGTKVNHYGGDDDGPHWIVENTATGEITRNVESLSGDLGAVTSKTGDTVLQLNNIHGDVALQLPLDTSQAPTALDNDEYGNPRTGQSATRYNWPGAKQRSTETVTGLSLMGARLYNPATGRFLSTDPVYGGNANAYEYCVGDPVNCYDLHGTFRYHYWKSPWWSPIQYFWLSVKFTRGETRTLTWGAGAAGGLLGIVKDYVPGYWKHVFNGLRFYAWYIAVSAGWIYYHTHDCAKLRGGYVKPSYSWYGWYLAPMVWRSRC